MSTIEERLLAKAVDAPPPPPPVPETFVPERLLPIGQPRAHETCRAPFNHDWVEYESTTNPSGGGWYLTMRCSKCGTIFRQVVDAFGNLLTGRKYKHPSDYKDTSKWSRTEWRKNYLSRLR